MNASQTQSPPPGTPACLHSRRRGWLSVGGLSLLCATLAAMAVWLSQMDSAAATQVPKRKVVEEPTPPMIRVLKPILAKVRKRTARAYLRIAAREPMLVFRTAETPLERFSRDAFDIYKNTQAQLLKSRFVLTAALRKPQVAKLRSVRQQEDPIDWLASNLRVSFPGKGEIMEVSLSGDDREEAAMLVNAVVDAYLKEVVERERNQRRQRLSEVDRVYTEKEAEVKSNMNNVRVLAEQLGIVDPQALRLKEQMALQRLGIIQREHLQARVMLDRARGELKVRRALLEMVGDLEIPQIEVDIFSRSDPLASHLFQQLFALEDKLAHAEASQADAPSAEKLNRNLEAVQQRLGVRREQLRQGLREKKRADIEAEIRRLEVQVRVLLEQEQQLADSVKQQEKETDKLTKTSIELEMMRAKIADLERVRSGVADERERLKVELRCAPRVTLFQRAEVPQ